MQERHKDLDDLIEAGSPPARSHAALGIVLLALPFLALFVYDFAGRLGIEHDLPRLPWEEPAIGHSEAWGDLIRLAGLPRYTELFPSEEERAKQIETNADGFRDPHPADAPADITVIGASFCAAGTRYEDTLPAQLAALTGRTARSYAWPGGGPGQSLEWALPREHLWEHHAAGTGGEPGIVVWGIVQRSLRGLSFHSFMERVDGHGELRERSAKVRLKHFVKDSLRWHTAAEEMLKKTSPARGLATDVAPYVPPIAIDPGWTSTVTLTRWAEQPALFFGPAVASVFDPLEARSPGTVVDAMKRAKLALEKRNQRLIVVLIPDKYQVARPHCDPRLDGDRELADPPVTTALAAQLAEREIEAIDLLPVFAEIEQASPGTLYRGEDTHWSDAAIRVAAQEVAKRLE